MWTLQELIEETWEQVGKPSDIAPLDLDGNFDINLDGSQQIKRWLNWGLRHICTWKFPTGELVRFSTLYERIRFVARPYTVEVADYDATSKIITLTEDLPSWLRGSHLVTKASGRWQELAPLNGAELQVIAPKGTVPTGEIEIYKREWYFVNESAAGADYNIPVDPVKKVDSVQRITDLQYGREVVRGARTDYWPLSSKQQGPPMAFTDIGGGIQFDRIPLKDAWYLLEYYGLPQDMEEPEDYPPIPAQFHEAVMLHAVWFGLRRQQEWSGAYSTKRDLQELMQTRRKQFEASWDLSEGFLRIEE